MKTEIVCVCDMCNKTITTPEEGFILIGNLYTANPSFPGGLLGGGRWLNMKPTDTNPFHCRTLNDCEVPTFSYHIQCFLDYLKRTCDIPVPTIEM